MPIRINFLFDALRIIGSRAMYGSVLLFYAVYVQAGSVDLAWNPSSGAKGYKLYWGLASDNGKYTSNVNVSNQTSYTISNLQDQQTYDFAVTAYDDLGESCYSNCISTTIGSSSSSSCTSASPCPSASSSDSSIWTNSTVPDVGPDPDTAAVEVGVKFKSDKNGVIKGIRFYKDSSNTGTHVGNLWKSDGTNLASATFSNETASGWQQVSFTTPVAITANTVYVASYHTNTGHYNDTQYAFSGKGVDNPPLHILADGASGVNGVYAYGSSSIFPTNGWRSSNYWVDVVFKPQ